MKCLSCWKLKSQFLPDNIHVNFISMHKNNSLNSRKIVKKEGLFRDGVDGWRCILQNLLCSQSMGSGFGDPVNIDIR
jgi:hypothetical protein